MSGTHGVRTLHYGVLYSLQLGSVRMGLSDPEPPIFCMEYERSNWAGHCWNRTCGVPHDLDRTLRMASKGHNLPTGTTVSSCVPRGSNWLHLPGLQANGQMNSRTDMVSSVPSELKKAHNYFENQCAIHLQSLQECTTEDPTDKAL